MPNRENDYLKTYAEPEIAIAEALLGQHFDFAVALPCFAEGELLDGAIRSLDLAARYSIARVVVVILVNSSPGARPDQELANQQLWESLTRGRERIYHSPPSVLIPFSDFVTLLVVLRSGPGLRLGEKWGVGGARKIACDLALALHAQGTVRSPIISTTDADARVAPDYFEHDLLPANTLGIGSLPIAAIVHPFAHVVDDNSLPLALYEIFLRYYVAGLRFAGSPFAFHTVGSCISFHATAYALVRGFPIREAGEDFYFLSKLAKVGKVGSGGGKIFLTPRESDRVPFGTGRGMARIRNELAAGKPFLLYSPKVFESLKIFIGAFRNFSDHRNLEAMRSSVETSGPDGTNIWAVFEKMGAVDRLIKGATDRKTPGDLLRHIHTAFDAFQTLKFVHALRDELFPNEEAATALHGASFLEFGENASWFDRLESLRLADRP